MLEESPNVLLQLPLKDNGLGAHLLQIIIKLELLHYGHNVPYESGPYVPQQIIFVVFFLNVKVLGPVLKQW